MTKYISVKEYAKSKGISIAEAYSRLEEDDMKPLVSIIGNIKMVKVEVAEMPSSGDTQPSEAVEENKTDDGTQARIATLEALIEEKDKKILELTEKLSEMAISSQKITEDALNVVNQAQILQAVEKQKKGFFRRLMERNKE